MKEDLDYWKLESSSVATLWFGLLEKIRVYLVGKRVDVSIIQHLHIYQTRRYDAIIFCQYLC